MNHTKTKPSPLAPAYPLVLGASLILIGCGGGSYSAPQTGGNPNPNPSTAISVVGTIDSFGSIYVHGIEFETDSTEYRVDDEDAFDDSALSVGMIVKVEGTVRSDGTGDASSVYYDDELEGPVANLAVDPADPTRITFTILGAGVEANASTTVFRGENAPGFGFDTLMNGDHVEVSGQYHNGMLLASFIKEEDDQDDDFEAKGTVSGFNGVDHFTLTLINGTTLDITLAPGALIPAVGINEGQFVEIEGVIPDPVNAPFSLSVTKVELEDRHDFDDDDDEVEIEGILSFDGVVWSIRSNELGFDDNTEYRPASLEAEIADGTADGRNVEIKGNFVDGVLRVERLKIEEDDLEIKGFVDSIDPVGATTTGTVTLSFSPATGTIPVVIDTNTLFMNDDSTGQFDLSDLNFGTSFVEIHAHLDEAGNIVAGVFELEDNADEYEVEGPLDSNGFVAGVSVSVLGVVFSVDANTFFEDGLPVDGDIVDVEDVDRDGTADSIDIED